MKKKFISCILTVFMAASVVCSGCATEAPVDNSTTETATEDGADQTADADKTDGAAQTAEADKADGAVQTTDADKADDAAKSDDADKSKETEKAEESDKSKEAEKTEEAGKEEEADKAEESEKSEEGEKAEGTETTEEAGKEEAAEAEEKAREQAVKEWLDRELKRAEEGGALDRAFDVVDITTKEVPIYYDSETSDENIKLAFFDADGAVPYLSADDAARLIEKAYEVKYGDSDFKLTVETEGDTATLTRENGCWMKLNTANNTITFIDIDIFLQSTTMKAMFDQIHSYGVTIPIVDKIFEHTNNSYERFGEAVKLSLTDYGIDLVKDENEIYIPLATVNDFILSPIYALTVYNSKCVIMAKDGLFNRSDKLLDVYYDAPAGEISPSMSKFSYNELCLTLDNHYGLKDVHDITSFDQLFLETGLKYRLLSTDPHVVDDAISEFITQHLDDLHSLPLLPSYYSGEDANMKVNLGGTAMQHVISEDRFSKAREELYPDGVPGYEEIGDTAFITFDEFNSIPKDADYYKNPPREADTGDTVGLMLYSYAQITRKGSPIKNVVMDLSCNGGGESSAAAFVIGTFLGTGTYSVKNNITGALMTDYYHIDLNLDHKFDEKDSLADYNLYCLEAVGSFSCGNLVPNVYKNSNAVTLLGQTSGGGSCVVLMSSTAHGMIYNVSGPYMLAFTKNGSFYDIDMGAEPDIYIDRPENYYDREALAEYINGLF